MLQDVASHKEVYASVGKGQPERISDDESSIDQQRRSAPRPLTGLDNTLVYQEITTPVWSVATTHLNHKIIW
jgi:hypothetical protein